MKTLKIHAQSLLSAVLAAAVIGGFSLSALAAGPANPAAHLKQVTTLAGSGEYQHADGAAEQAAFRSPRGVVVLPDGSILVADTQNQLIRSIRSGRVTTHAGITFDVNALGTPAGGLADGSRDSAVFHNPSGMAVDLQGNLYVADAGNNAIRKIDAAGQVSTHAGSADGIVGYANGEAGEALFNYPADVAVAADGTVYVADTLNHAIRRITPDGQVSTLNRLSERVVEVTPGQAVLAGDYKDGSLREALFNEPSGIAIDAAGNLYVSDSGNQAIRYIDLSTGTVSTVAGGTFAAYGDNMLYREGDYADGAAATARFDAPKGIALTASGGLLIADSLNHAIRLLQDGKVSTVVGAANAEPGQADGTEQTSRLMFPTGVTVAASGDIYVADTYNNKIRKISAYTLPAGVTADASIQVAVGDKLIGFDAQPEKTNDRVMVPVRAIAEAIGYEVETEDNSRIVLVKEGITVEFEIGSIAAKTTIDGQTVSSSLDAAPYIRDNRAYVPVRFISEQLDKQVDWIQSHQAVVIR